MDRMQPTGGLFYGTRHLNWSNITVRGAVFVKGGRRTLR